MAKYKNREVLIIREIPHSQGDQVVIEHLELQGQREIVPLNQVTVTKEELATAKKAREEAAKQTNAQELNEYRVEGDKEVTIVPTYKDMLEKKIADAHTKVHTKLEELKQKAK